MRRRGSVRSAAAVVLALLAGPASMAASAAVPATSATSATSTAAASATSTALATAPTVAAVEAAASTVRADPDLGGVRKERTWRLKTSADSSDPDKPPLLPPWLVALAAWLAESGRWLVWLLGAVAAAVLLVTARRWLRVRGEPTDGAGAPLPSHVRDLDIRPGSLPDDIGAAVKALWLKGERRAALSLLYRGALSRLVHADAVPIGDASTEGDCLRLARAALPAERAGYVAALVELWLASVYGERPAENARVLALCDDFGRMLPAAPP